METEPITVTHVTTYLSSFCRIGNDSMLTEKGIRVSYKSSTSQSMYLSTDMSISCKM